MTKREWLRCGDPVKMLDSLNGRASDRTLRLFAAACCRRIWDLLIDKRSRTAIEVLERFADGRVSETAFAAAAEDAHRAAEEGGTEGNPYAAWSAANAVGAGQTDEEEEATEVTALTAAKDTAFAAAWAVGHHAHPDDSGDAWHRVTKAHEATECQLLRDVRPHRPVRCDRSILTATIASLAEAADNERILPAGELEPARLAVLADALEEAGCSDEAILSHLRSAGPHVRGCWAVDLILGKE